MITGKINKIYDSGEILEDLSKSIFIAISKKPGVNECVIRRKISSMGHITKVIGQILKNKAGGRFQREISLCESAFGFLVVNYLFLNPIRYCWVNEKSLQYFLP